jgi:hypothetical protein
MQKYIALHCKSKQVAESCICLQSPNVGRHAQMHDILANMFSPSVEDGGLSSPYLQGAIWLYVCSPSCFSMTVSLFVVDLLLSGRPVRVLCGTYRLGMHLQGINSSGQPVRVPKDENKFRDTFFAFLVPQFAFEDFEVGQG